MATPSPTPVDPSSSRLDNSVKILSGGNRRGDPALFANCNNSFCLLRGARSIVTSLGERKSCMFMALETRSAKGTKFNRERIADIRFLSRCERIWASQGHLQVSVAVAEHRHADTGHRSNHPRVQLARICG